jgi:hypothetical protein
VVGDQQPGVGIGEVGGRRHGHIAVLRHLDDHAGLEPVPLVGRVGEISLGARGAPVFSSCHTPPSQVLFQPLELIQVRMLSARSR